jgi:galactokinase
VNLIGEHTDYNGGWVLPVATQLRTRVAVRPRDDARVQASSDAPELSGQPVEARLGEGPTGSWLDYVLGVAAELARSGRTPERGFDVAVSSDLPQGAGLSSSAALEVASALALASAFDAPFAADERAEVAELCRRAEADFVGVPCGIMDQWAALFADAGQAVQLRCSDRSSSAVAMPDRVELLVVDTGVRHALRDGGYAERLEQCARALSAARPQLGRPLETLSDLSRDDLAALADSLEPLLLRRARHVVTENERVARLVDAFRSDDAGAAGALLYASHESLRVDYEVTCAESDFLIEATRRVEGAYGARMTGAGFGGCTLHLVRKGAAPNVAAELASRFEVRFGARPRHWSIHPGRSARVLPADRD